MVRCQSYPFKARTLNFWKRTLNFWKVPRPPKNSQFWGGKIVLGIWRKKNSSQQMGVPCPFCKKMEKFRQIWPQQPLKHFTAAYRGSPPCTQSQHPINRETGYSNVLGFGRPHPPGWDKIPTFYKKIIWRLIQHKKIYKNKLGQFWEGSSSVSDSVGHHLRDRVHEGLRRLQPLHQLHLPWPTEPSQVTQVLSLWLFFL